MIGNPLLDPNIVAKNAGVQSNNNTIATPSMLTKDEIVVYQDFFWESTLSAWDSYFSDSELDWQYRMESEKDVKGNKFFVHSLRDNQLMNILLGQLEAITELPLTDQKHILDVYLNGQILGQDGGKHVDTEFLQPWYTVLFFPVSWNYEWGGSTKFFYANGDLLTEVPVKQGNVIVFPGNILHQGIAPTVPNKMRISLAVKTNLRFDVTPTKKI